MDAFVTLLRMANIVIFIFHFAEGRKRKGRKEREKEGRREEGRKEGNNYSKRRKIYFQFISCFHLLL